MLFRFNARTPYYCASFFVASFSHSRTLSSRIDPECLHWVAVDQSGQGVGTLRLYKYSATVGKVGRVAVLLNTRGSGLGRLLMEAMEKWVIENTQFEKLALSSQVPRAGFYEKFGYVRQGEEYPDEGQPHIYMEKTLAR